MKKPAILLAVLLLLPSALAQAEYQTIDLVKHTHDVLMKSQFITQGYEYARIQGINRLDVPLEVKHWHLNAEVGPQYAFCEMEPVSIPPGIIDVEIRIQCQTRSGFTAMYPKGTMVKVTAYMLKEPPEGSHSIESITIYTKPAVPTPFPVTRITGESTVEESTSTAGTFMFIAGIGAIIILAVIIVLASLMQKKE
ncbi:MAG: hypothetical protein QXR48_00945 [Candidatus Woesearchaeota archaeon]